MYPARILLASLIGLGVLLLGGWAIPAHGQQPPSGDPPAVGAPAACPAGAPLAGTATVLPGCMPGWDRDATPPIDSPFVRLLGVTAVAADEVWAVGYAYEHNFEQTLVLHWTGGTWSRVSSPNLGSQTNRLLAVAGGSPTDIWAVGSYDVPVGQQTLVEHWDGTAWTIIPSPNTAFAVNVLEGVSVVGPDNVWAVGIYTAGSGTQTLVEHWDGTAWTIIPSPNGGPHCSLSGIAGANSTDVWAVGECYSPPLAGPQADGPLTIHWDGEAWHLVPAPGPGQLRSVVAIAANDVWAVGYTPGQPLIEHWDGGAWTVIPNPSPSQGAASLWGITVRAPDNLWAVGTYAIGATVHTLAEHWNGRTWTIVPSADGGSSRLAAVAAVDGRLWAVGDGPVVVHYPGGCVTPTATPTHTPTASPTPIPTDTPTPTPRTPAPMTTRSPTPTTTPIPLCTIGTWNQRADYPMPIQHGAAAGQDAQIYSFGGYAPEALATAFKYDPSGDQWTALAAMPTARYGASVVSDGTGLYIINGWGTDGAETALYRYDPRNDSYTALAPAPVGTLAQAAVYLNGRIYRIGGCTAPTIPCPTTTSVDVYTISTNSWAAAGTVADYPAGVGWLTATASDGYIYGAGGAPPTGSDITKTYRYYPSTNQWDDAAVPDLPAPRAAPASGLIGRLWILAAGFSEGGATTRTVALDLNQPAASWQTLAPLPVLRGLAAGAATQAALYVIGGQANSTAGGTWELVGVGCTSPTPTPTQTPAASPTTGNPTAPPGVLVPTASAAPASATSVPSATWPAGSAPTRIIRPTVTISHTPLPAVTRSPAPPANATPCAIPFTDVHLVDYFYMPVQLLACRGVISGYSDGTFRPGAGVTRGQVAKFVANAAGYQDAIPATRQTFADVPPGDPFWRFIERVAAHGVVGGYNDGTFHPTSLVTRGQMSKFVANAAGYTDAVPATRQTFTDVPAADPFWRYVERVAAHGVVAGYRDGSFHPAASVTRGQTAKFVANAFFPNCGAGRPTSTPRATVTATRVPASATPPTPPQTLSATVTAALSRTATGTPRPTATTTPMPSTTPTATGTPGPTHTVTPTPTPTSTPTETATVTPPATITATATATSTPTRTPGPGYRPGPVFLTDVNNALLMNNEFVQVYNETNTAITLAGWQVCNRDTCAPLPTRGIDRYSLIRFNARDVPGWPAAGLDAAKDIVGLLDAQGRPIDSMNWGTPDPAWPNYAPFQAMLWNPGVRACSPATTRSFFRTQIAGGNPYPTAADWLCTGSAQP